LRMERQIDEKRKVDLVGPYDPGPAGDKGLRKGVKHSDLVQK